MSRREKPSLEELPTRAAVPARELHRELIAPEGSIEARPPSTAERRALAVDKGLQKQRRAA
jgi:hypothetical protein